ncbi:MAG: class I SAM-dependent methyltransferase [Myxococcales bacterium]|nr:class I SAM-dependent methyltransferase [Myxococcales bacterium]MCB9525311.1 class I SAM-dependent methyltransferase [Myxococcales bacterium]
MSLRFTHEPLTAIWAALAAALGAVEAGAVVGAEVPHPDLAAQRYDGEPTAAGRARPLEAWAELAAHLGATLLMPEPAGDRVRLRFRKLSARSWHRESLPSGHPEKYGADSDFARACKFEQPGFLAAWRDALGFLDLPWPARVLSLGCHLGAELAALRAQVDTGSAGALLLGVDHSASAIAEARRRHPGPPFDFQVHDLAHGPPEGLFDLVIAINVLHSRALDGRALLRAVVKRHLAAEGRVLLGFPNARHVDHRLRMGARPKHAQGPELSQLLVDVMHARRYLHQQRFKTLATGTGTVLLAGRRLSP